jgi:Fic family protein
MGVRYIHERPDWPRFRWDVEALAEPASAGAEAAGRLIGRLEGLGLNLASKAALQSAAQEITGSSAIEGERLPIEEVRSSIARRLGIASAGMPEPGEAVDGIVRIALDATERCDEPLTAERLFGWHSLLFPSGWSGGLRIRVGAWRDDAEGPMQVVSGGIGNEKVHFEAPAAERVPKEMDAFLAWLQETSAQPSLLRAGLAHLWFVTVHPFDDGNGRLGRLVLDYAIAQAVRRKQRCFSLSEAILLNKPAYYGALESAQKGALDVSGYLQWFFQTLLIAVERAEQQADAALAHMRFWERHQGFAFNDRQLRVLKILLDGMEAKLTNKRWAKITGVSHDTALRDIRSLVQAKILTPEGQGRSVGYRLAGLVPE